MKGGGGGGGWAGACEGAGTREQRGWEVYGGKKKGDS